MTGMADLDTRSWLKDRSLLPALVKQTEGDQRSRQAEAKSYLRCYYDRPVTHVNYERPYRELALFEELKETYGGNLTREVVDAACSIICRPLSAEVAPKAVDDFELEQGCKQATRLIEGVNDNSDFLQVAKDAFKDAMTSDLGAVLGYVDEQAKDEIKFERINPLELYWVDDGTPKPRTLMRITPMPRATLAARFPQHKGKLLDPSAIKRWQPDSVVGVDLPASRRDADTVKLVEVWCVALSEDEADWGRHVVLVDDVILLDDPWKHPITPVIITRWQKDFRGFGGISLARIVNRYDSANRRLLRMVYASLAGAVPQVLAHEDSEFDGFSDMEFAKATWTGAYKPEITVPKVVSPDVIEQIERNYVRAYAEGGVNQNMATGSAPARYTSGAAQREFVDIANTRLLDAQHQWQALWRDAAKVVVMLAEEAKVRAHVKVKGANYYEMVRFPSLKKDSYKVDFGLTSGLSLTPAGRLEELSELQKMGLADTADVARNLDLPDTRALADRLNAPRDLIMQQISICLDIGPVTKKDGKEVPTPFPMPSAMMDLPSAVRIGQERYQLARLRGNYPKSHVEWLRRWIKACQARMAPPPAPAMPAPVTPSTPPGQQITTPLDQAQALAPAAAALPSPAIPAVA